MIAMRFEGGQELSNALAQLSQRVSKSVARESLEDAAEPMRKAASRMAPRAPGAPDIADNIVVSPARGDAANTSVAMGPAKGFQYGFYLEFGTVRMSARPFMRPAFDGNVQKALDILRSSIWVALAGKGIRRATTVSGGGLDDSFGSSSAGLGFGNSQSKGTKR